MIRRRYDIDPADFTDEQALIEAVREARKRNGNPNNTRETNDTDTGTRETDESAEDSPQRLPRGAGSNERRTDVEAFSESGDGCLVFTGVDSSVSETIPTSELEPADEIRAARVLNNVEFRKLGRRDAVCETWEHLRNIGDLSEDDILKRLAEHEQLTRRSAEHFWEDTARETLAELPGVEVAREGGTPDPAEIEVETLANVIDGLREVGVGALDLDVRHDPGTEVWRAGE